MSKEKLDRIYAEALQRFPEREFDGIVMHPMIMSGEPCIKGRRISTQIIANRYCAGELLKEIAADYETSPESIDDAIRFELLRRSSRVWWKKFGYKEDPLRAYLKWSKERIESAS